MMPVAKQAILLLFLILFCLPLSAQITKLTAKITNQSGQPMSGNFILTDSIGNVIRKEGFTGGIINVTGISMNSLRLKLSSLLFADTTISIRHKGTGQLDLGTIIPTVNSTMLNQIDIKSSIPPVRYGNNGDLVVSVAGTILSTSSSVNEILSRTPGVSVSEGIISIQGKGEAIIYLNGSIIPTERLSSIPTSQIIKIEIIANPSAKYDAAGRAVIHITTKPVSGAGISGNIAQHVTYSDFAGTSTNSFLDLGYEKKSLAVFANLGILKGSGRELLYTTRIRPALEEYLSSVLTTDWNRDFNAYTNCGFGARYAFSPKASISLAYSGNHDKLGGAVDSRNTIITNSDTNLYTSTIFRNELRTNDALTLNFTRTLDTLGSSLSGISQYSYYGNNSSDLIEENIGITSGPKPRYLENNASHLLRIWSVQADLIKRLNTKSKLEMGLRFSTVSNTSKTDFLTSSQKEGPYLMDELLSSNFRYNEKISAAYTSFSAKFGKLNTVLGVRAEHTSYELRTNRGNNTTKNYISIFPNLQVEFPVNDNSSLRTSYTSRIIRPRYQALNPFVIYQDPFTTIEGNPNLVPERAHAFELAANFNKTELKLGYTYTSNQLTGAALRGNNEESYVLKSINISTDHTFLLSLTKLFAVNKWWQSVNTASLTYSRSIDNQYGFATGKSKPQLYLYTSNTFNLDHGIKLQLLAWYLGDKYYALRHDDKRSIVTLGIEKSLFENKLKIGLTANDIFNRYLSEGDYNVDRTQIYYNRNYGNNYYKVTVSYRIRGIKKSAFQNKQFVNPEVSRAN